MAHGELGQPAVAVLEGGPLPVPRQPLVLRHGQQWMFDRETLRLTASGDYRRFMRSLSTYDHCLSSMWPTVDGLMLDFKSSGQGATP